MEKLRDAIASQEDWIMQRILSYAREHGYVEYTSTLLEAWRVSLCGLSAPLLEALDRDSEPLELTAQEDLAQDPIAAFGILEAQRHRSRGVAISLFLGLMKYYRQAYLDLVYEELDLTPVEQKASLRFIDRFFDRVELGFVVEWSGHDRDRQLADQQRKYREITSEKNFYLTIFESLAFPVILIGDEGVITNMNRAAYDRFVGPGVPGAVYYGEGDMPYIGEDLIRFIKSLDEEGHYEKVLRTRHGVSQYSVSVVYLLDVNGRFKSTLMMFQDITEQTETEENLHRYKDRLEDLVAMRTAETSAANAKLREEIAERSAVQENLQKTIDQLTKSNTELERFANFASHDLKESARLVASYSQLLARRLGDAADEKVMEFLGFLTESGKRISQQVEDLLAYSRTHTRVHPFGEVETSQVITAALANMAGDIEETGTLVEVDVLPRVWCDQFQIQEVMQHLIGNAIKFRSPDRRPTIHVSCTQVNDEAEFAIRDNGIGINPLYADQIFVIFKRLHTKDKYPGSGIGLAMCKRIIERHGGRIWMKSEPGVGSTFRFTLPVAGARGGTGRPALGAKAG